MGKTIILSLGNLLPDVKKELMSIKELEQWDAKCIIEIAFSMIASSYDPIQDANKITARVANRIGLLHIMGLESPEKIFVLIYHVVARIYFELTNYSLNGVDLFFKQWLGNDIIVEYKESPIKRLTKL